jgi:hypothetical protein
MKRAFVATATVLLWSATAGAGAAHADSGNYTQSGCTWKVSVTSSSVATSNIGSGCLNTSKSTVYFNQAGGAGSSTTGWVTGASSIPKPGGTTLTSGAGCTRIPNNTAYCGTRFP